MEQTPRGRRGTEPLEQALLDHQAGLVRRSIRVYADEGGVQRMPVAVFFRSERGLRPADRRAIALCRGRVLDVGAGAGAVALALQRRGLEVTALDVLPGAVAVMRARGVHDARRGNVARFRSRRPYDTVLALMNGTAPAGTLGGLRAWLGALAAPLAPNGQLLIDSTDLTSPGRSATREDGRYVGELHYQIEYRGEKGAPFAQLFVDSRRLGAAARAVGLATRVVWRGAGGAYLARLTHGRERPPRRTAVP